MRNIHLSTIVITALLFSVFSCATQQHTLQEEETVPIVIVQETTPTPQEVPEEAVSETPPETLDDNEIKEAETDIAELIENLNDIIASKDFNSWQEYLSTDYIMYYSDPDVLKEQSRSPLLIKNKIVLRTIEDYFNYVVVGSRQNVKLDEIKVLDRDHIKAYMFINSTPVIIYELVRIDDTWKIGKFLE